MPADGSTTSSASGGATPDRAAQPLSDYFRRLLAATSQSAGAPKPKAPVPVDNFEDLERQDRQQDIDLKKQYAMFARIAMLVQIIVADGVFVAYAHFGRKWDVPPEVITAWLAATVIQVIGIVLVITKYLFYRPPSK